MRDVGAPDRSQLVLHDRRLLRVLPAALTFVIDLPLSYFGEYVRPHAYGLSNQTFGKWFGDSLKG